MQDFRVIVPTVKSGWGVRQNPKLGKVGLLAKAKGMRVSDYILANVSITDSAYKYVGSTNFFMKLTQESKLRAVKKIHWKNLAYLGRLPTKNFKSKIIVAF